MKILTLNTHSLQEENYHQKLAWFVEQILHKRPDLIALQEVNQTISAPEADTSHLIGMASVPGCGIPVRWDNHAAEIAYRLRQAGVECSWTWLPIKVGYDKYDEGLAILSLGPKIAQTEAFPISEIQDYRNWRTRKVLGVRLEGMKDWFYTVHMGWWNDPVESFQGQWQKLSQALAAKKAESPVWLLGDFNSPAEVHGEGYDHIRAAGWYDTYHLAKTKGNGYTVEGVIDGWRDKLNGTEPAGMRIDHIWCSRKVPVSYSHVLFNGKCGPQVSDHFAVLIETDL